ncbi:MAG: hypothetical protein ACI8W7_001896 [Gammaproteobacteria bacterium]|jgi:hypothetical protein
MQVVLAIELVLILTSKIKCFVKPLREEILC